jgi:predicted nucleotidyltransferase
MGTRQDLKVAIFRRKHLPRLWRKFAPLKVIAFGSRARGEALAESDLDLILVSPKFASMRFLDRPVKVLEALDSPGGLELLCYTPEEFKEKRREMGIVRVAVKEGIEL